MPPRRSARKSSISNASSSPTQNKTTSKKRKAESTASPNGKPGKKAQKTLEETMPELEKNGNNDGAQDANETDPPKDLEMEDAAPADDVKEKQADEDAKALAENAGDESAKQDDKEPPKAEVEPKSAEQNGEDKVESEEKTEKEHIKISNETHKDSLNDEFAVKSPEREKQVASNIIEKGIIYFFTRGRVGIEDPESVQDLQRTYFVMRPIPTGAKLGDAAIPDTEQNRLVALPKKVFPKVYL
jgi:hypothetical protein